MKLAMQSVYQRALSKQRNLLRNVRKALKSLMSKKKALKMHAKS